MKTLKNIKQISESYRSIMEDHCIEILRNSSEDDFINIYNKITG